jgi:hypothetical protein
MKWNVKYGSVGEAQGTIKIISTDSGWSPEEY